MERCGRLIGKKLNRKMWKTKWKEQNGKMWKTKWKEVEDKMERCERQMGKSEDYQLQMQD